MRTITLQLDAGPIVADLYAGPVGAPTVLLIHGWGGSGRYWRDTIDRLADRFSLVVPDLPGVGRALPVRHALDMFGQVAALEALLADLAIERAHVVGHSMGGGLAILLAARRPDLVERLVLTSICLFRSDAERAFFGKLTEAAGAMMRLRATWMADLPFMTRQFASRFFYRVPNDQRALREGFLDYLQMDHATALASARSASSPELPAAAGRIQAPTLLVAACQDKVMPPANIPYTLAIIPGSRVRWIDRCGHLPMVEQPDEYAAILREFLGVARSQNTLVW